MKYVMVIYQGTTPAPDSQEWASMSEEEQKQVYADYQALNQIPGVTPGPPMGLPENATTVRVQNGRTLTTDGPFVGMKEAVGGMFVLEADDLDAAIEVATRVPAARLWRRDRDPARGDVLVATLDEVFRRGVGPGPGHPDRPPRRLRPRRGGRPGGVRHRRPAVAARWHPRPTRAPG